MRIIHKSIAIAVNTLILYHYYFIFLVRYHNTTVVLVLSSVSHQSKLHLRSDSLIFLLYQFNRYIVCLKTSLSCTFAMSDLWNQDWMLVLKPLQFALSLLSCVLWMQ